MFHAVKTPDRIIRTDSVFDQNNTALIKGIAILLMVLHHTNGKYYNAIDLQWYSQNSENIGALITLLFSTAGKVCVQLLTILSGFGLSKSYIKYKASHKGVSSEFRFILSHLIQFYSIFWINLLLYMLRYGVLLKTFKEFGFTSKAFSTLIIQIFGFSKAFDMNGFGDWFVAAIVILYIIFPVIFWIAKKNMFIPIILSILPWLFKPYLNGMGIHTDSVIFCLLAFVTGILFAQKETLDKLKSLTDAKYKVFSVIFLLIAFSLRLVFSFYADYFFALSLICFGTLILSGIKYLNRFFILFGKNSANIWLSHPVIITAVTRELRLEMPLKYFVVLAIALLLSVIIEKIKRYSDVVKKARAFVEKNR